MGIGTRRNSLCDCGSGKKYKRCHFLREQEAPLPVSSILEAERRARGRRCLHEADGTCRAAVIQAHTVQRALLEKIAVDGHVYGFTPGLGSFLNSDGNLVPTKVGLSKASTFTGFCGPHDKKIFAPIEDHPIFPTKEHAFLLSYRALCKELYAKLYVSKMGTTIKQLDRGRSQAEQKALQNFADGYLGGAATGRRDIEIHKRKYDKILKTRDFSSVRAVFIELSTTPHFMVSGALFPDYSFSGETLQDLSDQAAVMDAMTFSIVASGEKGLAVLTWLESPEQRQSPSGRLADSLAEIAPEHLADALTRLTFEYFENTLISPSWWDVLHEQQRSALLSRMESGMNSLIARHANSLAPDGVRVVQYTARVLARLV